MLRIVFATTKKKIKQQVYKRLEQLANRIHPKNPSGNNQSKM